MIAYTIHETVQTYRPIKQKSLGHPQNTGRSVGRIENEDIPDKAYNAGNQYE